eukprot:3809700-Rhodomonas_salina.2
MPSPRLPPQRPFVVDPPAEDHAPLRERQRVHPAARDLDDPHPAPHVHCRKAVSVAPIHGSTTSMNGSIAP